MAWLHLPISVPHLDSNWSLSLCLFSGFLCRCTFRRCSYGQSIQTMAFTLRCILVHFWYTYGGNVWTGGNSASKIPFRSYRGGCLDLVLFDHHSKLCGKFEGLFDNSSLFQTNWYIARGNLLTIEPFTFNYSISLIFVGGKISLLDPGLKYLS